MASHTVSRRATDSSGRGIFASDYHWNWWLEVLSRLDFTPSITQGAWMTLNGGGAQESAGYHDGGGCFDLRVWDLRTTQQQTLIRELRRSGSAAWLRDERHGGFSDPHIHLVLGTDHDLDDGAAYQWRDYLAGGDGMGGRDYHWRPDPLVTKPPEDRMDTAQETKLDNALARIESVDKKIDRALERVARTNTRLARANDLLREAAKTDKNVADALAEIQAALADAEK